jgi:hypothetical protein
VGLSFLFFYLYTSFQKAWACIKLNKARQLRVSQSSQIAAIIHQLEKRHPNIFRHLRVLTFTEMKQHKAFKSWEESIVKRGLRGEFPELFCFLTHKSVVVRQKYLELCLV